MKDKNKTNKLRNFFKIKKTVTKVFFIKNKKILLLVSMTLIVLVLGILTTISLVKENSIIQKNKEVEINEILESPTISPPKSAFVTKTSKCQETIKDSHYSSLFTELGYEDINQMSESITSEIEEVYKLYNSIHAPYNNDLTSDGTKLISAYWNIPESEKQQTTCPEGVSYVSDNVGGCFCESDKDITQRNYSGNDGTFITKDTLVKYIKKLYGENNLTNNLPKEFFIGCRHLAVYNSNLNGYSVYAADIGCADSIYKYNYRVLLGAKKNDSDKTLTLLEGYINLVNGSDLIERKTGEEEYCSYYYMKDNYSDCPELIIPEKGTSSCPDLLDEINKHKYESKLLAFFSYRLLVFKQNNNGEYYLGEVKELSN